ncbi:hypothetical protein C3L33_17435, partial [Rhododendron williamsianum]
HRRPSPIIPSPHINPPGPSPFDPIVSISQSPLSLSLSSLCLGFGFSLYEKQREEMGQQSLIYSFVARGTVVLAEYTGFTGNFTGIASQCLQKLPATNNKFTYNCDGHTFNYLVENGFSESYLCGGGCLLLFVLLPSAMSSDRLLLMLDSETFRYYFVDIYKIASVLLIWPKLKEQMQYCVDHPEEISKLAKVLDRGEKIELLVDKTENLRSQPMQIGARFQAAGDTDKEEDVVPEHENKIDRFQHYHCADSRHFSVHMPWLQMCLIKIVLLDWFSSLALDVVLTNFYL